DRGSGESLAQGEPDENAALARAVLAGNAGGIERSLVLLNAGAALYVAGVSGSIQAGVRDAGDALDSGAAGQLLERYVERTQSLAPARACASTTWCRPPATPPRTASA